jgi:hypothetical protein
MSVPSPPPAPPYTGEHLRASSWANFKADRETTPGKFCLAGWETGLADREGHGPGQPRGKRAQSVGESGRADPKVVPGKVGPEDSQRNPTNWPQFDP